MKDLNPRKISNVRDKSDIDEILDTCEVYRSELISHCLKCFSYDYDTAEDMVQYAYVALYENLLKGNEVENYRAWLYRVTFNYACKETKVMQKRNECNLDDDENIYNELTKNQINPIDYVENIKVSDEQINELAVRIISQLDEEERQLYISYYCKHKKLKEIAEDFNMPAATVRQRHARLKRKLKKMIQEF